MCKNGVHPYREGMLDNPADKKGGGGCIHNCRNVHCYVPYPSIYYIYYVSSCWEHIWIIFMRSRTARSREKWNLFTPRYVSVVNALLYPGTTQILLTINVNTRPLFRKLSTPLPLCLILLAIDVNWTLARTLSTPNQWARSQLVCFNENIITLSAAIKSESLYQLSYISSV